MKTAKKEETIVSALKDYEIWYWDTFNEFVQAIEKAKYEPANKKTGIDELVGYHGLRLSDL